MKRHAKEFRRALATIVSGVPFLLLIVILSIGAETARASVTATIFRESSAIQAAP